MHLEEIETIVGHKLLGVLSRLNSFKDHLNWVKFENSVVFVLLMLVSCVLGPERSLDHIIDEILYILLKWYFIVAMVSHCKLSWSIFVSILLLSARRDEVIVLMCLVLHVNSGAITSQIYCHHEESFKIDIHYEFLHFLTMSQHYQLVLPVCHRVVKGATDRGFFRKIHIRELHSLVDIIEEECILLFFFLATVHISVI